MPMPPRRELLRAGLATATLTWVAPSVVALDRVAAAAPSAPCEVPTVRNGARWTSPPASIVEGGPLDSNTNTYVWLEQGPLQLTSALVVNRTTAGNFNGGSNQNQTIPAGTWICSYYVHGDRLDDNGFLTGGMQFASSTIIGLIYRTNELNASSSLRAPGTTYGNAPMESGDVMSLGLTPGANTLSWRMRFGPALDGIRVITACP